MSRSKNISSPSSAGRARLGFRVRSPIIYESWMSVLIATRNSLLLSLQRHLGPLLLLDFLTLTRPITSLTGDEQTWITQLAF